MLLCAVLALAWLPAAIVLVFRDTQLRPVLGVLGQLWPLVFIPLCGFALSWWWRGLIERSLRRSESV
jgi:hypothetical protein